MRTAPKVTLIIGALMLVGSIVAVVVGIGSTDFEDMVEQEVFTGEAPTNWDAELQWSSIYFVYVEEGSNVSAEIHFEELQFLPSVVELAKNGIMAGGTLSLIHI